MARLGITDAIAFDRHFAEYGRFALLRHRLESATRWLESTRQEAA